jgi:REP element-mobilizing transposase RayT
MQKVTKKFYRKSLRLETWDYSWPAAYFIIICTHNRQNFFGKIENKKMILSKFGQIACSTWLEIKSHSKNTEFADFVIMPNHVHGIIILKNKYNVETRHALSLQNKKFSTVRYQNPGKNSISSIIGSYKSAVSKEAHKINKQFKWQSRFYDHIILNEESFEKISLYIKNNPINWKKDNFFNQKFSDFL